jgi:hypothetical protein
MVEPYDVQPLEGSVGPGVSILDYQSSCGYGMDSVNCECWTRTSKALLQHVQEMG